MKTILMLGGYGFLGTNIIKFIDQYLTDEYRVVVFDKFAKHPAGVAFSSVELSYSGDFFDEALISQIFEENHIDLVIHCISTTIPSASFSARFDIESNLVPTVSLMDTMIRHGVLDMVYLSSGGAIYGSMKEAAHKEDDDVFPISSYGVVKLAIEKYLMQYSELYGLRPLIVRLSNPYGPWHYSMKQGVCNIAIVKALKNEVMSVWGDGNGRKDYIFVEDFVTILFDLIRRDVHTSVVNIASGELKSVNEILEGVRAIVPSFQWEYTDASVFDVPNFALDTTKLQSLIGAYSFTPMEEGLKRTFDWVKEEC